MGRKKDWVLEAEKSWWLEEYDYLPFRTNDARKGYPTREAACDRRAVVLADLQKNWGIDPVLRVVPRTLPLET